MKPGELDVWMWRECPLLTYPFQPTFTHIGMPRATQAASVEKPFGSPVDGPQLKLGKGRTVMQQHCDFFDRDGDGVISCWDTYVGFRNLGMV